MSTMNEGETLWNPSEDDIRDSRLTKYIEWLSASKGKKFEGYRDLWNWSVSDLEGFWESIWEYFQVKSYSPYSSVIQTRTMPGAKWFKGAKLNFAEHVFARARWGENALRYRSEDGRAKGVSWEELSKEVASLSETFRDLGIRKGDRIAAYASAVPETAIAFLSAASIGAIWTSIGAELAPLAAVSRLSQLDPKILISNNGYVYNGKEFNKQKEISYVLEKIPSLETAVSIPSLESDQNIESHGKNVIHWEEASRKRGAQLTFEPVDFDHPLWVLYSSGTTGIPKPIVHGHGGMTLESFKHIVLHHDIRSDDRFLWPSTPSWMVWNVIVSSLFAGATILFYDGSQLQNNFQVVWEIVDKEEVTVLGVSAPFLHNNMKAGIVPRSLFDLKRLRELCSTAAPLSPKGYEWVYENVNPSLWLNSTSGGTDVCTGFVGGCLLLPVTVGEMQCRLLGVKAESYDSTGNRVVNEVGELVIEEPMPSMPLFFWGDSKFEWYTEAYFGMFPGIWRNGDWMMITDRGTVIIYGRSDSTIKRSGVRIGTLDLYKVVESLEEVQNSMAVEVNGRLILFLVPRAGFELNSGLQEKVVKTIRNELSPHFVPDYIIQVSEIPTTLNFKKLEVPTKKLLLGWSIDKAVNMDAVANPRAVSQIIEAAKPVLERIQGENA